MVGPNEQAEQREDGNVELFPGIGIKEICKQNTLSLRGTFGEHTEVLDSTYDISYKKRLGMSEKEIIQKFIETLNRNF